MLFNEASRSTFLSGPTARADVTSLQLPSSLVPWRCQSVPANVNSEAVLAAGADVKNVAVSLRPCFSMTMTRAFVETMLKQ